MLYVEANLFKTKAETSTKGNAGEGTRWYGLLMWCTTLGCQNPENLKDTVFVHDMSYEEPVEKLYYAAKFEDIFVHCSSRDIAPQNNMELHYLQCEGCIEKPKIAKKKKKNN